PTTAHHLRAGSSGRVVAACRATGPGGAWKASRSSCRGLRAARSGASCDAERQQVTLSVNGLIELGAGRGFAFTHEEIRDALAERAAQAATGELNSSELDAVSGGTDHDALTASRFQISIDGYQNATFSLKK